MNNNIDIALIERNNCIIDGSSNLKIVNVIDKFPVFMGCTKDDINDDIFAPLEWAISDKGIIQLKKLIPLDLLYKDCHGSGTVGKIWQNHHAEFAKFIYESKPEYIFEIGGGTGILEVSYHKKHSKIPWTIIEPNPLPHKESQATFIKGFFDSKTKINQKNSTIVHSHVLEHIYDPMVFMNNLSNFCNNENVHIFSVPNMDRMLQKFYTNALNFEHTYLLNESLIDFLLQKFNFKIVKKKYFMDDHSIFYYTKKIKSKNKELNLQENKDNLKLFDNFISYYKKEIIRLNQIIDESKKINSNVFIFGAHIFSQYLIASGLNQKSIKNILDNDPNKANKRLYGTILEVKNPSLLRSENKPVVILKAGVYNSEIQKQLDTINPDIIYYE